MLAKPPGKTKSKQQRTTFKFEPLVYLLERRACLGYIEPTRNVHLQLGEHQVAPAQGDAVQTQQLLLISPAPRTLRSWPRVRRDGVLKAVGRAIADASSAAEPELAHWWLACQLALHGFVTHDEWKVVARKTSGQPPELGPRVEPAGPYLVWQEYLGRLLDRLRSALVDEDSNPLLLELTATTVRQMLDGTPVAICNRLLEMLAQEPGFQLDDWHGEPVLKVAEQRQASGTLDEAVVNEIMTAFATGNGAARRILEQRHPGHRHVVRWLFDAGWLVEAADGFVFTKKQLDILLKKVLAWDIPPAQIGVGTLKGRLGLPRRRAEGLRSYLIEKYGADDDYEEPARAAND